MMKLWYSTTSPYVRKVLATLQHHQQTEQVELLKIASSFDPNSPHNMDNPLGRVPALQLPSGEWLLNSLLICEYLDTHGKNTPLFPTDERRWSVLSLHALADGVMENTVPIMAEKLLRPENEWWTVRHQQLMDRNLRSFLQLTEKLPQFGEALNIGTIAVVALIDWWRFREKSLNVNFAKQFPELTAWAEDMNEKYVALRETKPHA